MRPTCEYILRRTYLVWSKRYYSVSKCENRLGWIFVCKRSVYAETKWYCCSKVHKYSLNPSWADFGGAFLVAERVASLRASFVSRRHLRQWGVLLWWCWDHRPSDVDVCAFALSWGWSCRLSTQKKKKNLAMFFPLWMLRIWTGSVFFSDGWMIWSGANWSYS